jgi:hypothetical protein
VEEQLQGILQQQTHDASNQVNSLRQTLKDKDKELLEFQTILFDLRQNFSGLQSEYPFPSLLRSARQCSMASHM